MKRALFVLLMGSFLTLPAWAMKLADVDIPDQTRVTGSSEVLILNGAGIRRKFFFKIYIGGLYLPENTSDVTRILAMPGAKRVLMHFLYKKVDKKKLDAGWRDGFEDNFKGDAIAKLEAPLKEFTDLFGDVSEGDRIWIDQVPGEGTLVTINDKVMGTVTDEAFFPALLQIWIGDHPVTDDLKRGMLGQ